MVSIDPGRRDLDVQCESADQIGRVRADGQCRDVAISFLGVERLKSPYLDKGRVGNLTLINQQLGYSLQQLSSRFGIRGNKFVVQWLLERDLNFFGSVRDRLRGAVGCDGLRQCCGHS